MIKIWLKYKKEVEDAVKEIGNSIRDTILKLFTKFEIRNSINEYIFDFHVSELIITDTLIITKLIK
jgi:hypothetical protein